MSQTRSNAGEELDGVSDGEEEFEDSVVDEDETGAAKPSRAERKAAKRRAKRDKASGKSAPKSPRKKRTSPALFIRQILAELRKVVWPTRGELLTYTSVVIVFVVAIIGIVALFDYGITHAVSAVFG
ncbi:MAG TPA: preprotein translocase subunit SecE [Actinospica sp.]|nr:preprotein translocase subunit SecE [Actinospica sp.]